MTESRRRINLPPSLVGALVALFWAAVVVIMLGVVWPIVEHRFFSRWAYYGGLYDPLTTPRILAKRIWGTVQITAIPALAGGALLGRLLSRLVDEGRGSRGWASCLGAGVALAVAEILALIVAASIDLVGGIDAQAWVWLVDTMARILLGIGGPAVAGGLIVGWRLWTRLAADSTPAP